MKKTTKSFKSFKSSTVETPLAPTRFPNQDLLTSAAAAQHLGVAVSTLKRWADEGIVPHVRTAGGHRRFRTLDLYANQQDPQEQEITDWIELLLSDSDSHAVLGALRQLRGSSHSWREAGARLAKVTSELGRRWAMGQLSIYEEHQATEKLIRGMAHCSDSMPVSAKAPVCLLAVPERDEHSLGLTLLEPCLRELGWRTRWLGRQTPATEVAKVVRLGGVNAVALSASAHSRDRELLRAVVDKVGSACAEFGIPLWLGGAGAWPPEGPFAYRLRSLDELADIAVPPRFR